MARPILHAVDPNTSEIKTCSRCNLSKPLTQFFARGDRTGCLAQCKACRHVDQVKSRLKRLYGMTVEDYNTMFLKQEGFCAICDKHQSELKKRLNVDHDHRTGRVRGLLCPKCNKALGLFNDSSEVLDIASKYLKG